MKRGIICVLVILCLLLSACQTQAPERIENPFALYFPRGEISGDSAFAEMTISLDASQMTLSQIVTAYHKTQPPSGADRAIPTAWVLKDAYFENTVAVLHFGGEASTAVKTNIAAACLLQTLLQLPQVEEIRLHAPGNEKPLQLAAEDVLLKDTGMLPQKESIVFYLSDPQGLYLNRQTSTVEALEAQEKPQYIMQKLVQTGTVDGTLPRGTKLIGLRLENGICTVNLSSEFVMNMRPNFQRERLAVYSIVNSLTELDEITTVDFWIEGAPLEELSFMKLPAGLQREESLIASDADAQYVKLYLSCDNKLLVALPFLIESQENVDLAEQTINALLALEGFDGAQSCLPEGTKLLDLRMEGSACIVDLTGDFISGCGSSEEEILAVRSIVATMYALDGISSVEILVEGLEPNYSTAWLKNARQPEKSWFAEN